MYSTEVIRGRSCGQCRTDTRDRDSPHPEWGYRLQKHLKVMWKCCAFIVKVNRSFLMSSIFNRGHDLSLISQVLWVVTTGFSFREQILVTQRIKYVDSEGFADVSFLVSSLLIWFPDASEGNGMKCFRSFLFRVFWNVLGGYHKSPWKVLSRLSCPIIITMDKNTRITSKLINSFPAEDLRTSTTFQRASCVSSFVLSST